MAGIHSAVCEGGMIARLWDHPGPPEVALLDNVHHLLRMVGWSPQGLNDANLRSACRGLLKLGQLGDPAVTMSQVVFARAMATCLLAGRPEAQVLLQTAASVEEALRVEWCRRLGAPLQVDANTEGLLHTLRLLAA